MAHSNWLYQTRDIMFQIKEWLGVEKLLSLDAYKEYYGMDDIDSFLDVNFKVCRDVMCPANKDADEPGDNLRDGTAVNRDMVMAAALLHDITKTRSLETKEPHDVSGGALLRGLGFTRIAEIVEQHVILEGINLKGELEEREIVYYADKRVMHDEIVTLDERMLDLQKRYGLTEDICSRILKNKGLALAIERKIARFMKVDLQFAIEELRNRSRKKSDY